MKKFVVIFCCLFLLVGCDKNKNNIDEGKEHDENSTFILKKDDESKDYVYFEKYREVPGYDGNDYILEYPIINIDNDEIDNVNLELKNFVVSSFKDFVLNEDIFSQGNVISYDYYVTDKYVTVIQKYYLYIDGMLGDERDNVYVVSLEDGSLLSNTEILDDYGLDENSLYKMLEERIESDDVLYSLMNIKNEGYILYVDKDNKLCIIYYEYSDDEEIRKELVLN